MTRTGSSPRIRLGITVGDPAGIGPEVVARALQEGAHGESTVRVYGDVEAVERFAPLPPAAERRRFATARVEPGHPDPAAGPGVIEAIRAAARDCLSGALDAMVTAPISKELLARSGFRHPGHTELLEEISGGGRAVMMLVGGELRVALATIHCALREVPDRLTTQGIEQVLRVVARDLTRRFGVAKPRIAVCGLNPHAGEGGRFGDEEERIIRPAVESSRREGVDAFGPLAADSLFTRAVEIALAWDLVDGILDGWARPDAPPLEAYGPGSGGPAAADRLVHADGRRWNLFTG